MADDKERELPDETLPKEPEEKSDGWDWDAAVPQTDTSNISFDELQTAEVKFSETAPEEAAEPEEKEEEKEEEAPEEKSDDDGLCIVCGKPRGSSPSDLYCNACRAKFLRTNYGVGHIILAFVMVIVAALGYFIFTATGTVSDKLFKAEQAYSEKRYDDALNLCSEVSDTIDKLNSGVNSVVKGINGNARSLEWFSEGSKATHIVLDCYTKTMMLNPNNCNTYITSVEKYFTEAQLNDPKNADIKELYEIVKDVNSFADTFVEEWQSFITQTEDGSYTADYDKAIKYLDSIETKNDMQKSYIEYFKFWTAYYAQKDGKTAVGFMKNAYDAAGDYGYLYLSDYLSVAWQYEEYDTVLTLADKAAQLNANDTSAYYYAIKVYINRQDFDSADKLCEKMKEDNPDVLDYYSTKAEILRRQSKFEDAVEICRKGIVKGSDPEVYRQQAIAYLLMSDKENALEAIKQSYELAMQNTSNGVALEEVNTVALICFICGDTETYDEIVSMFEQQKMELDDSVKKCIKGDITFEDIFMKGSGEVS